MADKSNSANIMYKVVLELAIVKDKNLVFVLSLHSNRTNSHIVYQVQFDIVTHVGMRFRFHSFNLVT